MVGHCFTLDMGPWGKQACEVLAVEHERLLQYRYGIGALDILITWHLAKDGDGTALSLTHGGFNLDTPMGKGGLEGMRNGWPSVLTRLGDALPPR